MESGRKKSYAYVLLASAILALLSVVYIDYDERRARATHDAKVTTIGQIFQQFGYGGAIHAFKNYVLRGNESDYETADEKLVALTALVDQLEAASKAEPGEILAIEQVRAVIEEYRAKLAIARSALADGMLPGAALDQRVRVDDAIALDGIAEVITLLDADQKALSRLSRNKRWLAGFVLTAFFGIYFVLYFREIGFLENTNASLVTANEELLQFTYRSSHDLKAPLITIRGLSKCVVEDLALGDHDEIKTNVNKIEALAARLEQLVSGLLKLAKADLKDGGNDELNMAEIVNEICSENQAIATQARVRVMQDIDLPQGLVGSQPAINLVLSNLITNSIRYADPQREDSYVEIRARYERDALQLQVSDNGLGIPEANQTKVFGMFHKAHPDQSDGSGLGLYMVKKTVERLGGTISLDSNHGEGSVFRVSMPLEANV